MIDNNVIISICGFITTITVTVLNQRASARKSKEDREEKAMEVKNQLELSAKVAELKAEKLFREQSEELSHKLAHAKDEIQEDLAKNTEISVKAFDEANHVNEKIKSISEIREVVEDSRRILKDRVPLLQDIATDTSSILHELECKEDTDDEERIQEAEQRNSIQVTVEDTNRVVHEVHDPKEEDHLHG